MSTHDRTRSHRGTETTAAITLAAEIAELPAGTALDTLLTLFATGTPNADHLEVMMFDFGTGLEPITDEDGDWLYGHYPGV